MVAGAAGRGGGGGGGSESSNNLAASVIVASESKLMDLERLGEVPVLRRLLPSLLPLPDLLDLKSASDLAVPHSS